MPQNPSLPRSKSNRGLGAAREEDDPRSIRATAQLSSAKRIYDFAFTFEWTHIMCKSEKHKQSESFLSLNPSTIYGFTLHFFCMDTLLQDRHIVPFAMISEQGIMPNGPLENGICMKQTDGYHTCSMVKRFNIDILN